MPRRVLRAGRSESSRPAGAPSHLGAAAGAAALALLAWQGHHLARWLPQFERTIESLGPWGPVVFCACLLALGPLLVPDTLFALAAGAAFGIGAGMLYYFGATYVMCLGLQWLASRGFADGVLRLLERHGNVRALVSQAPEHGARLALVIRLIPLNPALVSYALGAAGVPLRAAAVGNLAMFVHMFPTLYLGAAAVHMTRMAGTHHRQWETQGILLMVGLAVCAALALGVTRWARSAIDPTADAGA